MNTIINCLLLLYAFSGINFQYNAVEIKWDQQSLRRISSPDSAAFYPRILQKKDGSLLAVYSSRGNIVMSVSFDAGNSWISPAIIANKITGVNMDTPEIVELRNGVILVCYNGRPQKALSDTPETGRRFDIRVKKSYDGGESWKDEQILYTAAESFKDGCWEPAAIQLPSGEIQLFFSNEAIYTNSNEQNISLLRSVDNAQSWSTQPQIISFRNNSRDGMPVPVWLEETKQVAIAIEDPGDKNFKPYILKSWPGGKWERAIAGNDSKREYAFDEKIADSIYAGAPYLRQLSSGETILSYQSTENRKMNTTNRSVMIVRIGDRYARHFSTPTIPFNVEEGYNALWNSLCVLRDNSVIAVSSTNAFSKGRSEIWMIKGHVIYR